MLGGQHIRQEVGQIHNFWLDVYDTAGIFSFVPIVCISIQSCLLMMRNKIKCMMSNQNRYLFWLVLIVGYIQFMTEPAYEAEIIFVWCIFFVFGVVNSNHKTRRNVCAIRL